MIAYAVREEKDGSFTGVIVTSNMMVEVRITQVRDDAVQYKVTMHTQIGAFELMRGYLPYRESARPVVKNCLEAALSYIASSEKLSPEQFQYTLMREWETYHGSGLPFDFQKWLEEQEQ